MSDNPYAPPAVENVLADDTAEEAIRRAHIKHETSVKSLAFLNFLGVFFAVFGRLTSSDPLPSDTAERVGQIIVAMLIPAALLWAGISIRRLGRAGQILNALLFGIALVGFPIGTIIGAMVLYHLFCKKGRMVFSAPYRKIVKNTPHIKYQRGKTSKAAWVILIVFILFIALGIFWLANH